jgi:hypothetical protein
MHHACVRSQRKRKIEDKRYFYQDFEFLATTVPGSANFYPYHVAQPVKNDRMNCKLWIEKHKK